jgi:SAM-dependent MidA family methyltransferase
MSPEPEIRRRIAERGPITFAEFMEVALYWPRGGYYAARDPVGGSEDRIGAEGDYYTSPLVHPAFGALLAVQLFQMWQIMERPAPFTVVEQGAGNGLLGRDIISFAAGLPARFIDCLMYVCVDRRVIRGLESGAANAHRVASTGLPVRPIQGCVLSNEYLDAFPVHQVIIEQGGLKEVYVAVDVDNGELVTRTGQPSTPALAARFESLGLSLREGQTAEVNLGLAIWAQEAAAALERGFVMTVDYGRPARELYSPDDRFKGTLTTFHQHLQTDAPLKRLGQQDITAQVDFTSAVNAGRGVGLEPLGCTTQRDFLYQLNLAHFLEHAGSHNGGQREIQAGRAAMLELVKPGGLGDFKVLAQGKNVGQPNLWGFKSAPEAQELVARFPAPTQTPSHLNLAQGRYPSLEMEFEPFWPIDEPPEADLP